MLQYTNSFINMKLSVILPVYNEEPNIHKGTIDKVITYLEGKFNYEIIVVDDGSSDKTVSLIQKNFGKNPLVKIIPKEHQGKAYSIIRGIQESKYDTVFFTDFDLATPIEELDKLLEQINKGNDIVIGSRSNIRKGAPLTRKILSKGLTIIRDILIGLGGIKDTQCGFKAFKREAALSIIEKFRVFNKAHTIEGPSVSAAFDLEFLFIAKQLGFKIKEVPVVWTHVETRNVNFIRDAYESMKDILMIRFNAFRGAYK